MTSLSAKTVHMLDIFAGLSEVRDRGPKLSRSTSRACAITSRNRPVPAAHFSFITKSFTRPVSSMDMALESCPPMSMTVRAEGKR